MKMPDPVVADDLTDILSADIPWEQLCGCGVLITGASGFIGGHLVEALAWLNRRNPAARIRIHALARHAERLKRRLPWLMIPDEVVPVIQDVTAPVTTQSPIHFIIHAASPASPRHYLKQPVATILANTEGTRRLLDLARLHRSRLLFLSSGAVYGESIRDTESIGETDFGADDPLSPRACYGESKRLGETLCRAYFTEFGVDACIARVSHCYGPGMSENDGRAIADLLDDVRHHRDIRLDSDGSASRPFCYVSDTVLGLFHVLLKGKAGEAYNVGETRETTILELAQRMIDAAGKRGQLAVCPHVRDKLQPPPRHSGHFNIDKLRALGWAPRVDLKTGLERLLASGTGH